jgi:hypothetical protein
MGIQVRAMLTRTMELRRETIEAFIKAYKNDFGEDLTFAQAHEIAHRLVNIFLILERAVEKRDESNESAEDSLLS